MNHTFLDSLCFDKKKKLWNVIYLKTVDGRALCSHLIYNVAKNITPIVLDRFAIIYFDDFHEKNKTNETIVVQRKENFDFEVSVDG